MHVPDIEENTGDVMKKLATMLALGVIAVGGVSAPFNEAEAWNGRRGAYIGAGVVGLKAGATIASSAAHSYGYPAYVYPISYGYGYGYAEPVYYAPRVVRHRYVNQPRYVVRHHYTPRHRIMHRNEVVRYARPVRTYRG
ncbi:MAG: hypothetical protein Q8M31_20910 [Beijerinckiaceae bacterium]|nr:hypothetical protein [Beijerinckiaceae bacterium]